MSMSPVGGWGQPVERTVGACRGSVVYRRTGEIEMMDWVIAAAAPLSVLPVGAGQSASTEAGATDIIKVTSDRYDRLTVPVRIGDNGPYDFLIDTGSER